MDTFHVYAAVLRWFQTAHRSRLHSPPLLIYGVVLTRREASSAVAAIVLASALFFTQAASNPRQSWQ